MPQSRYYLSSSSSSFGGQSEVEAPGGQLLGSSIGASQQNSPGAVHEPPVRSCFNGKGSMVWRSPWIPFLHRSKQSRDCSSDALKVLHFAMHSFGHGPRRQNQPFCVSSHVVASIRSSWNTLCLQSDQPLPKNRRS